MEKENTLRLLRRICMAFLAVYLVLALCAPVLAEEAAPAQDAAEQTDGYAAVQAQLEAVARNEGREIAGQMLFESFRAISPAEVPQAETEPSAEPAAASGGTPSVVVHAEPRVSWSFSGLLPFLVVVAATAGVLVVFSARRQRAAASSRSYRPMYDRNFRDKTFEKHSRWKLDV